MSGGEVLVPEAVETVIHRGRAVELEVGLARLYMRIKRSVLYAGATEEEMGLLRRLVGMGLAREVKAGAFALDGARGVPDGACAADLSN